MIGVCKVLYSSSSTLQVFLRVNACEDKVTQPLVGETSAASNTCMQLPRVWRGYGPLSPFGCCLIPLLQVKRAARFVIPMRGIRKATLSAGKNVLLGSRDRVGWDEGSVPEVR